MQVVTKVGITVLEEKVSTSKSIIKVQYLTSQHFGLGQDTVSLLYYSNELYYMYNNEHVTATCSLEQ